MTSTNTKKKKMTTKKGVMTRTNLLGVDDDSLYGSEEDARCSTLSWESS